MHVDLHMRMPADDGPRGPAMIKMDVREQQRMHVAGRDAHGVQPGEQRRQATGRPGIDHQHAGGRGDRPGRDSPGAAEKLQVQDVGPRRGIAHTCGLQCRRGIVPNLRAGPERYTARRWLTTSARPAGPSSRQTRAETQEPELYRVILHNDDYTTMEFVVQVLETVFHKTPAEAFRIMMQVHTRGPGAVRRSTRTTSPKPRSATVHDLARERGFPLRARRILREEE